MTEHESSRNIKLYYLFAIFNEPLFWGPILITSLQKLGNMPLADIYYMEAVVLGICVCLDIPAGALADRIGRKWSIVLGRIILLISAGFFMTMSSPIEAWIGNILWAIGSTLQSGADTALVYDSLKEHGRQLEYKKIIGQSVGGRLIVVGTCSLLTGFLANIDLRLPLHLSLPFVAIPLFVSLWFTEACGHQQTEASSPFSILRRGAKFILQSPKVRWMVGFAALLGMVSKVWFFTYNPYFELVGVKITHYGLIFFLLNVVAWLSSHFAHKIEEFLGEKISVVVMTLCLAVPILLMSNVPIEPFAYLVLVQNVARGFMAPFVSGYLNHHITSDIRATVLSAQSTISNLAGIVGLAVFGHLTAHFSLVHSLTILGCSTLILGGISFWFYLKKIS